MVAASLTVIQPVCVCQSTALSAFLHLVFVLLSFMFPKTLLVFALTALMQFGFYQRSRLAVIVSYSQTLTCGVGRE